jgi:hypothetical protein
MIKLSPTQQDIIDKLKDGWILRTSNDGDSWISRVVNNKLERTTVRSSTVFALRQKGLITSEYKFPISKWTLVNGPS